MRTLCHSKTPVKASTCARSHVTVTPAEGAEWIVELEGHLTLRVPDTYGVAATQ
jgi:hypothetical protein